MWTSWTGFRCFSYMVYNFWQNNPTKTHYCHCHFPYLVFSDLTQSFHKSHRGNGCGISFPLQLRHYHLFLSISQSHLTVLLDVWPLDLTWKSLLVSNFLLSLLCCKIDSYFQLNQDVLLNGIFNVTWFGWVNL